MRIYLPCGHETVEVSLPPGAIVLEPARVPALGDPAGAVRRALAAPLAGPPLGELARGRADACLVVSDITRPVPHRMILPPLLADLEAAGLGPDRVTILVATGMHRPNLGRELEALLGAEIAGRYRVINHRCDDPDQVREIARVDGAPVEINRHFLDADLKILTGLVEPHPYAGFSGGRKSVLPGLASLTTLRLMHGHAMIAHPGVRTLSLDNNPFHGHSLDAARAAGADFILNVTLNGDRQISGVYAGELDAAHLAACADVAEHAVVEIDEPADLVLTSAGGAPLDTTFYQSTKGILGAAALLRPGGAVVLVCGALEGMGSESFCELINACPTPEQFHARHGDPANFALDQWAVQSFYQALSHLGAVQVYAPGLGPQELAPLGLRKIADVGAALRQLLPRHRRLVVIPQGPYVAGRVRS